MSGQVPTRPVLRYFGGKWRLARWILSHFPEHRIYVEPFGGGGSVLMQKERVYSEVYNDLDEEVCNVFEVLRSPSLAAQLRRDLQLTPYARGEFEAAYQHEPGWLMGWRPSVEQARRTLIKSFMGFGSGGIHTPTPKGMRTRASVWRARSTAFRSNAHRSGTTPATDWRRYPDQIDAFTERLQGVVIESRPWYQVLASHDRHDTLFYLDPPYVPSTRSRGATYTHELTEADHVAIADALREVDGYVVISGYPSALYDDLYTGWHCVQRQAQAASQIASRTTTEALWLSPRTWEALCWEGRVAAPQTTLAL